MTALDSIERAGNDVLSTRCRPGKARFFRPGSGGPVGHEPREEQVLNTELAYDFCEAVTRQEAKNFAYGIRLLRRPERRALSAVYALARRIDDIGDGPARPS